MCAHYSAEEFLVEQAGGCSALAAAVLLCCSAVLIQCRKVEQAGICSALCVSSWGGTGGGCGGRSSGDPTKGFWPKDHLWHRSGAPCRSMLLPLHAPHPFSEYFVFARASPLAVTPKLDWTSRLIAQWSRFTFGDLQGSMRGSWRSRDAGSGDRITALHASASWLIVGRASGALQSYALPSLQYSGAPSQIVGPPRRRGDMAPTSWPMRCPVLVKGGPGGSRRIAPNRSDAICRYRQCRMFWCLSLGKPLTCGLPDGRLISCHRRSGASESLSEMQEGC